MRWLLRPLPLLMAGCIALIAVRANDLAQAQPAPSRAAVQSPASLPPPDVAAPQSLLAEPEHPASDAQRALLFDLRTRRTELDRRERAVAEKEAMLAALQRRMAERLDELSTLREQLDAAARAQKDRGEAGWRGLVRTYEAMRPREAAAIFNELDLPVLLEVLDRMKENRAAPILGLMQPERARQATAELASKRQRAVRGE